MTNNIGSIGTGRQFRFGETTYVRIPEMILQCDGVGFVVNAIRVEQSGEIRIPSRFIAEFLHPATIVDLIQ